MSTNVTPANTAGAPEAPPGLMKALDQTVQGLAKLYMECHKVDPNGPLCEAVMNLQKATAEIAKSAGMPAAPMDDPTLAGGPQEGMAPPAPEGELPPEAMMPAEGMPVEEAPMDMEPLPPGSSIEDAAGATHDMMLEAAARRRLGA